MIETHYAETDGKSIAVSFTLTTTTTNKKGKNIDFSNLFGENNKIVCRTNQNGIVSVKIDGILNSATENMGIEMSHKSADYISSEHVWGSGTAEPYL